MNPFQEYTRNVTRRYFFKQGSHAVGWAALNSLLAADGAGRRATGAESVGTPAGTTHFPGKVKNIIYLHMVGGPAQMDLYDYKPQMDEYYDKDLPETIRNGQRLTTM